MYKTSSSLEFSKIAEHRRMQTLYSEIKPRKNDEMTLEAQATVIEGD